MIRDNQSNVINYAKSCGERPACSSFEQLQCSQQTEYQICDQCSTVPDSCYCPGECELDAVVVIRILLTVVVWKQEMWNLYHLTLNLPCQVATQYVCI